MLSGISDPNRTRASLIEGVKDPENQKRWTQFYDRYSGPIRDGGRRAGLRPDETEDLVITVLVEVSRKAGEFTYDKTKGRFRSWLSTVTARRAIDLLRKRRPTEERKVHRPEGDGRDTPTLQRVEDLDETSLDKMIQEEWVRALFENTLKAVRERVSPKQYQIYDAYALQNWPVEKVVKTYGVTENQVYSAKTRVGKIVKEEGLLVAEEMDNPRMPPEHPGLAVIK